MAFDYKKEYKEFYLPKSKPVLVTVPPMNFIAVRGKGNPNEEGGAYKQSISLLYGIAFTIKMSKMGEDFQWISMIRLPEFVTEEELHWAATEAAVKKKVDFSKVEFLSYDEGLCVQCMHMGPYDDEPSTIEAMDAFTKEQGYLSDIGNSRYHHEIYLRDARKCRPENLKTVIRHPVKAG